MKADVPGRQVIRDAMMSCGYRTRRAMRNRAWYAKRSGLWTRRIGFTYNRGGVSVIYRTDSAGQEPYFVDTLTIPEQELGDIGVYVDAIEHILHHTEGRIN